MCELHLKLQYQFIKAKTWHTEGRKYSRTWEQLELNATIYFVCFLLEGKEFGESNLFKKQVHPYTLCFFPLVNLDNTSVWLLRWAAALEGVGYGCVTTHFPALTLGRSTHDKWAHTSVTCLSLSVVSWVTGCQLLFNTHRSHTRTHTHKKTNRGVEGGQWLVLVLPGCSSDSSVNCLLYG